MRTENIPMAAAAMLLGVFILGLMDATAKYMGTELGIALAQIVFARFAFQSVVLTGPALWSARRDLRALVPSAAELRGHFLRGFLIFISTMLFFGAIQKNPIPDALAAFFIEPLIVFLLARKLLGEAISWRWVLAGVLGFAGVLIVLWPGLGSGGEYHWTIVCAPIAAFTFAGYMVSARFASFHTPPLATAWLTGLTGVLFALPGALLFWTAPDGKVFWGMCALGIFAASGHYCVIRAMAWARASVVAPLQYAEIFAAAVINYFVFRHVPGPWMWTGFAVIAGAKLWAATAESRATKRRRLETTGGGG